MMIKKVICLLICFMLSANLLAVTVDALGKGRTEADVRADKTSDIVGTESVTVTIDENTIIREANPNLLGVGTGSNTSDNLCADFFISGTTILSEAATDLMSNMYNIPTIRYVYSGGALNSIGPMEQRKSSLFSSVRKGVVTERQTVATKFGPVELINTISVANKNAEYVFCIDIDDEPENCASFARFLMDKQDESEWGALRAKYGVAEPVKVIFELGNERDEDSGWKYNQKQTEWYTSKTRLIIDAIKAVRPDARFAACGKTAPWNDPEGASKWTKAVSQAIGKDIQFWVQHLYYSGYEMPIINSYLDQAMKDLNETLGENHGIKFMMTEHGKWPALGAELGDDMLSLKSVLATANFINSMYMRPDMYATHFHTLASPVDVWGMIKEVDSKFLLMGSVKLYDLYLKSLGDNVVSLDFTGSSEKTQKGENSNMFSAVAMSKGKRELNILLCNRMPDYDVNVDFQFKNKYKLVEETVFTAPNIDSMVISKQTEDVFTTTVTEKNIDNFSNYKLPNKSFVVLKLVASSDVFGSKTDDTNDEMITNEEASDNAFIDIDNSWAKKEILALKAQGIVSGVSDTSFEPQSSITRAQFAAMVTRLLKLDDDFPNCIFEDVQSDSWYKNSVNAVYFEGIMRGDGNNKFRPDDNITIEEVIIALNKVVKNSGKVFSGEDNVSYAINAGILYRLYENGNLQTAKPATRAETASMLYRLYNLMK